MKADGLLTKLGEACVNGKATESIEHLISFSQSYQVCVITRTLLISTPAIENVDI